MNLTPVASRMHIHIFGKRNAGKSSLINAITKQSVALVSHHPGTTTDPVAKTMEILPIGPVVLTDTAGLDDEGEIGSQRVQRSIREIEKADIILLVVAETHLDRHIEEEILTKARARGIPVIGVINKVDLKRNTKDIATWFEENRVPWVQVSALTSQGIEQLKGLIIQHAPNDLLDRPIVRDLVKTNGVYVMVTPIDAAAPKGRIILPQVQTLRELLDAKVITVVVQPEQLADTLKRLGQVDLVITDSQAFAQVEKIVPNNIALTSFSILFARYKGSLKPSLSAISVLKQLPEGSKILIAEACTHHQQKNDIGRVQIPALLTTKLGKNYNFKWVAGRDFPEELREYDLVIHCGGCMVNRREMLYRINQCVSKNVPVVNYGILLAYLNGILERIVVPV